MRRVYRRLLGLALATTLLFPVLVQAQTPTQQVENSDLLPLPKNILDLLNSRRGDKSRSVADNDELIKQIEGKLPKKFNPKLLEDIKNILRNDSALQDPRNQAELRKLVGQYLNGQHHTGAKLDQKTFDELFKHLQDFSKNPNLGSNYPIKPFDPNHLPSDPMNSLAPDGIYPQPTPRAQAKKDEKAEMLARMLARNFGDSTAFREMAVDLAKMLSEDDKNGEMPKFVDSLETEWKSMMGSKNNDSPSSNWGDMFSGLRFPDMNSAGSGGSEHGNSGGISAWSDNGSSRGGNSAFGGWSELLPIVALVAGGLLCWYLYVRSNSKKSNDGKTATEIAAIDPLTIATREDVVKAFDAMSIAKCGDEAMNWHHRQIANNWGGKEPVHRDAVNCLAGLYEKARYAPIHEVFTELDVAEARTRLCQVAGVPTA